MFFVFRETKFPDQVYVKKEDNEVLKSSTVFKKSNEEDDDFDDDDNGDENVSRRENIKMYIQIITNYWFFVFFLDWMK